MAVQRQDVTSGAGGGPNGWDGAGGAFSTAPGLLRFAGALGDGTVLPDAPNAAQRAYWHSGGLMIHVSGSTQPGGANTILTIYPDLDPIAIVLSNYALNAIGGTGAFLAQQDAIITGRGDSH